MPKQFRLVVIGIWIFVPACAERRISGLLDSMLDGGPVATEKVFYETVTEDYIAGLSPEDVRQFLPLAHRLLQDSRPEVRKYAMTCFLAVTLRRFSDSEPLLEPYVSDLLKIGSDRSNPLRTMALHTVGNTWPKRSPKTVAYLQAHLTDKENSAEDTGWMACMLLMERSDPLTQDVIAFVRKRNNPDTVLRVLECLHVYPTKNGDALDFIGASLERREEWVRRRTVEAAERVPVAERSRFVTQLNRLAADPMESPEIRSLAAEALKR